MPDFHQPAQDLTCASFSLAIVHRGEDDDWQLEGTAALIGENLAITNNHVINGVNSAREPRLRQKFQTLKALGEEPEGIFQTSYHLLALRFDAKMKPNGVWQAIHVNSGGGATDFALLHLMPLDDIAKSEAGLSSPTLNFHLPTAGADVSSFGFPAGAVLGETLEPPFDLFLQTPLSQAKGKIQSVRASKELKNYPIFETDLPTQHGMSGGPVVSQNGELIGLNSSMMVDTQWSLPLWPILFLHLPEHYRTPEVLPEYARESFGDRLITRAYAGRIKFNSQMNLDQMMRFMCFEELAEEIQRLKANPPAPISVDFAQKIISFLTT